ncbi:MAG: anaerobic ribonucleoside-triphosphate reductase [[Clostridium] leptum]
MDAPFNLQYYQPGRPETEVAYMGCRTGVAANVYDPSREITTGRGNLSYTSINLPRLGILANKNIDLFFELLTSASTWDSAAARPLPHPGAEEGAQLPLPDGAGRVDRLGQAGAGGRGSARFSNTAP